MREGVDVPATGSRLNPNGSSIEIMDPDRARNWMWAEACEMISRAERLHRELFRPARSAALLPVWEPPVDVLETEEEVLVVAALPGVASERVEAVIEAGHLVISGTRVLPPALRSAIIHRLELPQGRFERRLPLPAGRYSSVRSTVADCCLVVTLQKAGPSRG